MLRKTVLVFLLLSVFAVGSASAEEIVVDRTNPDNMDSLEEGLEKAEEVVFMIVMNEP